MSDRYKKTFHAVGVDRDLTDVELELELVSYLEAGFEGKVLERTTARVGRIGSRYVWLEADLRTWASGPLKEMPKERETRRFSRRTGYEYGSGDWGYRIAQKHARVKGA